METITASEAKIGDVLRIENYESAFNQHVVINRTKEKIVLFRPYVSLADFTYTGGVIPYIGISHMDVLLDSTLRFQKIENIYRGEP